MNDEQDNDTNDDTNDTTTWRNNDMKERRPSGSDEQVSKYTGAAARFIFVRD